MFKPMLGTFKNLFNNSTHNTNNTSSELAQKQIMSITENKDLI